MQNNKAIVTLTLGKTYQSFWERMCRANWEEYARRNEYDVIALSEPLDPSPHAAERQLSWQKCLILSQPFSAQYERIVWLDADILINPDAPDISAGVPLDKVGATDEFSTPSRADHQIALIKLYSFWESIGAKYYPSETPEKFYGVYGLPGTFDRVVQSGVLVMSPEHHRKALEEVYFKYFERGAPRGLAEMRALSFHLQEVDMVHWLDYRFNNLWLVYLALNAPFLLTDPENPAAPVVAHRAFHESYMLHFAGNADALPLVQAPTASKSPAAKVNTLSNLEGDRDFQLTSPVILFIYNRADKLGRMLEVLGKVKPKQLFVIADGAREDVEGDAEKCAATRALLERVDWECDFQTEMAERNLGIKTRVESGLRWAFEKVEGAIILEDDCLPDPTFFRFCQELLEFYKDHDKVMCITGDNFTFREDVSCYSYLFSRYTITWGWATWRRAWRHYDPVMSGWGTPEAYKWLADYLQDDTALEYWKFIFDTNFATLENWDQAWILSCWRKNGLCIQPNVNLVSNIGFGADATHTKMTSHLQANVPTKPMEFPLVHPAVVARDVAADEFTEDGVYGGVMRRMFDGLRARAKAKRG